MPTEEWRDVVGSNGRYQVSSLGRVRGITVDLLTPINQRRNYKRVSVVVDGKRRLHFVWKHLLT